MLAESWYSNVWFINSEGVIVNEKTSAPAYHEIYLYSYGENCIAFTEKYHIYNTYDEDRNMVDLYEAVDGEESVLLDTFDDPNNGELWDRFGKVRDQYTLERLEIELIPICYNENNK